MLDFLIVSRDIMHQPWILTDYIAKILGWFINIFFYLIHDIIGVEKCSLGLAIIGLTIFVRLLLLPMAYKQQKSMYKMQLLSPEIKKLQEKYPDAKTDPEVQRKLSLETQKLYSENNVSPLGGCLPLIIQLPIFFGLYYVMQNPYLYINGMTEIYNQMSAIISSAAENSSDLANLIFSYGSELKVPDGTVYTTELFNSLINCLGPNELASIKEYITDPSFSQLYAVKTNIEWFLGINLTETVDWAITPKLVIPLLSGLTTFLSNYLMTRRNKDRDKDIDPTMRTQQKIMNIVMPLMMAWITLSLPVGIGVYWITSNIFLLIQQAIMNRIFVKNNVGDDIVIPKQTNEKKKKKKNKNRENYPRQYR